MKAVELIAASALAALAALLLSGCANFSPRNARDCDPNYTGRCVPAAEDVDCRGASGNGPAYVSGPVQVVGDDIYELDPDNDGIGCE